MKIDRIWSRFTKEIYMRNTFPINPVHFSPSLMFQEKGHTKLDNHIPYKLQEVEWSSRNP